MFWGSKTRVHVEKLKLRFLFVIFADSLNLRRFPSFEVFGNFWLCALDFYGLKHPKFPLSVYERIFGRFSFWGCFRSFSRRMLIFVCSDTSKIAIFGMWKYFWVILSYLWLIFQFFHQKSGYFEVFLVFLWYLWILRHFFFSGLIVEKVKMHCIIGIIADSPNFGWFSICEFFWSFGVRMVDFLGFIHPKWPFTVYRLVFEWFFMTLGMFFQLLI